MASDNTIRIYTALDIEKYHKGVLSPKERHDLEKAALDDPFLADALEGYAIAGVDVQADNASLKNRLFERTAQAKVVSMHNGAGKTSFPWLRAAAMLILIAGAGLLVYQFAFNKKNTKNNIAASQKAEDKKSNSSNSRMPDTNKVSDVRIVTKDTRAHDTSHLSLSYNVDALQNSSDPGKEARDETNNYLTYSDSSAIAVTKIPELSTYKLVREKTSDDSVKGYIASGAHPTFGALSEADLKKGLGATSKRKGRDFARDSISSFYDVNDKETQSVQQPVVLNEQKREDAFNKSALPNANRKDNNMYFKLSKKFSGRVTDANDNGLPFANVTNVQDNVGTYTDAKGYFNLTSTDSVLNVQVRSLGFNSYNAQLRNNLISNQVILQEDKSLAVQTLPPRKINTEQREQLRYRDSNMKLEGEPEPEDGWSNYDSYLSNNLNIPDDALRGKQSGGGSVEVSFEVNKYGEPVKFKIVKSLCDKCDQEAIRLIKEGPKWKRKARKGRTTVTISF